jgi:hypothetical protein
MPMTSSSLRTKLRKYQHKVLRRPSLANYTKVVKKYPDVEAIKWSKDCPKKYEGGKNFLPNRVIRQLPLHMRRFHDWYLRVIPTKLTII